MYKLSNDSLGKNNGVICTKDNAFIPFAPDNTDYQAFKKDIANGVELQDPTGTPITGSALTTFIQGLK